MTGLPPGALGPDAVAVLRALLDGWHHLDDIAAAAGVGRSTAYDRLADLAAAGLLADRLPLSRGAWAPARLDIRPVPPRAVTGPSPWPAADW